MPRDVCNAFPMYFFYPQQNSLFVMSSCKGFDEQRWIPTWDARSQLEALPTMLQCQPQFCIFLMFGIL